MNVPETELHFLIECEKYKDIREKYFSKFESCIASPIDLRKIPEEAKLSVLLGERTESCRLAALYVTACHNRRDSDDANTSPHTVLSVSICK